MKLNTAPQHAVVMGSGVTSLGEYKINNSPKAFAILSSGLYANKILAILRELGCNAWDSHVAAGRTATPFDLHLPTQLEPWFAIRDYGTGLNHDQVVNIYTTYFESTKTGSNDFIGALGLGSKSPFSYTDNFTVTAVRDGQKGIYTAFINDRGVPAIAQLMQEATDEPAGVEVKFAVDNPQDYDKFRQEARWAYTYFAEKPVVNIKDFKFNAVAYLQENIVPGVSQLNQSRVVSRAVMGNIAYPIQVPNAEQNLGELHSLLNCNLELRFDIGELDFQASREGLSYIPMTVAAIRNKLALLNDSLVDVLAKDADAYNNDWNKALFLARKYDNVLWRAAVVKYVVDTKFELFQHGYNSWDRLKKFEFTVEDLATKYNIAITGFTKYHNETAAKNIKTDSRHVNNAAGQRSIEHYWGIRIADDIYFAVNDTKIGAAQRGKYHWRVNSKSIATHHSVVYIASPHDKSKPMQFDAWMKAMHMPPQQCKVSEWTAKPRATKTARDVAVLKLEDKDSGYYSRRNSEKVWRDAGRADSFDASKTHYYLPLSGYNLVTSYGVIADAKTLCNAILGCGLETGVSDIYGVRKADLDWVKLQKNWVNLEDHMVQVFKKLNAKTLAGMALTKYNEKHNTMHVSTSLISKIVKADSAFVAAVKTFENVESIAYHYDRMNLVVRRYAVQGAKDPLFMATQMAEKVASDFAKYPMLKLVGSFRGQEQTIADYINLIDAQ